LEEDSKNLPKISSFWRSDWSRHELPKLMSNDGSEFFLLFRKKELFVADFEV
jgi:hypothetical protein